MSTAEITIILMPNTQLVNFLTYTVPAIMMNFHKKKSHWIQCIILARLNPVALLHSSCQHQL